MSKDNKWVIDFRIYSCTCGKCFWSRKHFIEHLTDTRGRWGKYHRADNNFVKLLVHKKGKNINEAFEFNKKRG